MHKLQHLKTVMLELLQLFHVNIQQIFLGIITHTNKCAILTKVISQLAAKMFSCKESQVKNSWFLISESHMCYPLQAAQYFLQEFISLSKVTETGSHWQKVLSCDMTSGSMRSNSPLKVSGPWICWHCVICATKYSCSDTVCTGSCFHSWKHRNKCLVWLITETLNDKILLVYAPSVLCRSAVLGQEVTYKPWIHGKSAQTGLAYYQWLFTALARIQYDLALIRLYSFEGVLYEK